MPAKSETNNNVKIRIKKAFVFGDTNIPNINILGKKDFFFIETQKALLFPP